MLGQKPAMEVKSAELRLWQNQLLDFIDDNQMEDRKIIWVKGQHGNEGKSWFQSYVQIFMDRTASLGSTSPTKRPTFYTS